MITGQERNADLGEDLAQAVFQGNAHVGLHLVGIEGGQLALLDPLLGFGVGEPMAGGLPGEPWADRTGAVTDQAGHVMGAPALGGVNHQGAAQTQLLPQQVVMHRPHSQEGRHRHAGGGQLGSGTGAINTIGEHQHLGTAAHSLLGRLTQPLQGR